MRVLFKKILLNSNKFRSFLPQEAQSLDKRRIFRRASFCMTSAMKRRTNRMESNMWRLELSSGDITGLGSAQRWRLFAWTNFKVAGTLQNWTTFPLNGSSRTRREKR
jgi:hypothetical protein